MTSFTDNLGLGGLELALAAAVLGVSLHSAPLWRYHRFLTTITIILVGASTGFLVFSVPPIIAVLLVTLQIYHLFSLLRLIEGRADSKSLRTRSFRSELFFGLDMVLLLTVNAAFYDMISGSTVVLTVIVLQLLCAMVFFRHVRYMFTRTILKLPKKFLPDTELPTITVAIPARNETADLTDCLQSTLASDYPKLEVLVVDDCSQDKTSDIIKSFAHRGVRFVKGQSPPESWIAKNYAYDQLLQAASGQYILFCGTDVRFEPSSIRTLVNSILAQKLNMVSVLPIRPDRIDHHFLLQPMRYWRELVFPRLLDKTPPVLSTCWIARREMLIKHGGFEGLRKAIRPERFIARGVALNGNYRFVRSSAGLGVSSVKTLPVQWETAIRTRYPEYHSRPETVVFMTLWQFFVLFGPLVSIALVIFVSMNFILAALAFLGFLYLLACHSYVHIMTTGNRSLKPLLLYPISVILELVALNYSMWAYEFSEVMWKGRNVCLPVLTVTPKLPKL